jgi:hypothetical protein
MIDARFVPIDNWPGAATPEWKRKRAPFRSAYAKTLDLLESELKHLKASDILIQAYLRREDIRNDGWPRSAARPSKPGIIVTFKGTGGQMSFPCDRFDGWEDNLRAIALSLEALRMVDRYGVTRNNEQYRGFTALPPASNDRGPAITFFARVTGWQEIQIKSDPQGAYRLAARACHPDTGGNEDLFNELQKHWAALR